MKTRVLGIAYQLAVHRIYEPIWGTTETENKPSCSSTEGFQSYVWFFLQIECENYLLIV